MTICDCIKIDKMEMVESSIYRCKKCGCKFWCVKHNDRGLATIRAFVKYDDYPSLEIATDSLTDTCPLFYTE